MRSRAAAGPGRGGDRIRRNQDTLCCSGWSAVCGEQVEGPGAVVFGGAGVGAGGVEAGVAEQVGDDNKVGAAADECGGEGVPADVGG